ncbi:MULTISPECIES: calcium-binding protein [unclassified Mesorhizobium]|uniref:calcium-binding protein n=1 Tax=unclassified Mesorhizobium TaxID=325217 RepID=UPI0030151417
MATITVSQSFGSDLLGFLQDVMENQTSSSGTDYRKTYTGPDGSSYVSFRGQPIPGSPGLKTIDNIQLIAATTDLIGEPSAITLGTITGFSLPVADVLAAANQSPQALLNLLGDITFMGNAGRDVVTLADGNDVLHLGAGNDEAHGGAGNDLLEGWSGHDVLYGDAGNDLFYGNTGNDRIYGGDGNDTIHAGEDDDYLDGGAGADILRGSTGNDTYVVSSTGDQIVELAGEGTDTVRSHTDWTLGANLERLELQGSANLTGNGNSLKNTLIGNAGNNILRGGAGNDLLSGGAGKDTLVGGTGGDAFHFNAPLGSTNIDKITDYNLADDMIQLENAVFTGLANGWLSAGAFHTGAAAHDASDRIIYNKTTGDLYFDKDGLGGAAATKFATLSPGLAMTAGEFFIV